MKTAPHLLTMARQYWSERNPRERRLLLLMSVVLVVAVLWMLFDWQASERARLNQALPLAQAQVKAMQDDAAEVARLRVASRRPPQELSQLAETLKTSAAAQGLAITTRVDGDRIVINGTSVPFDTWVAWLAGIQAQNALRVALLDASPNADGQRIEARLVQAP